MTMAEYQQVSSMAQNSMAPNSQVQVSMAMTQAQLPTLAPAPPHGQQMHSGPPMQPMQGAPPQGGQPGGMPGQPQMTMQQAMGQPQFQVLQPNFNPGGQYATFPQFATYNQQGQLVLQPAQFAMQGPGGQGQQIILSGVPGQPGKPNIMGPQPSGPSKPIPGQQPQYTITSSGQLQMAVPGAPQSQGQTFMLAPQMSGMPGMPGMPSSIAGPNGQSQVVHTSMAGMKGNDGKSMQGPPQMPGQPTPQQPQFVLPPGMAYMQSGPQQILQNGQLIFRSPGQEQPLMFSPTGQPPQGPPQAQAPHPGSLPPPNNPMPGMTMPGTAVRPSNMPSGAPPGKTAISRAIAPLLPTTTQTNPRTVYNPTSGNLPNQPSPKSKQKMSPRGNNVGPGRPPGPKAQNTPKMMPRMAGGAGTSPMPGSPGSPTMNPGSPRPPMLQNASSPGPHMTQMSQNGPPTLTPMMFPSQPTPQNIVPPQSIPVSLPLMSHSMPPKPLYQMPAASTSIPTSSVPPTPIQANTESSFGPPTLTKEVNPPMPNLGPPNISNPPSLEKAPSNTNPSKVVPTTQSSAPSLPDVEPGLVQTPKAVVKPQVLTHVIDGHIIKESSQPFPVSPTKKRSANGMSKTINDLEKMLDKDIEASSLSAPVRRKSEKDDKSGQAGQAGQVPPPNSTAPIKRGPGRPPGSNNKTSEQTGKVKPTGEPPEKKSRPDKESVAPLTNGSSLNKPPTPTPTPPTQPIAPLTAIVKNNPLKWNVSQVCDFIKNLPGCSDYVEDFAVQEIDGQALMLLQADHLMTAMSIKLGPALKICEQVKQLKDELNKN